MEKVSFRQRSTGFPLARIDDRGPNPEQLDHEQEVGLEYGIPAADIERVPFTRDPRKMRNCIFPPPLPDTRTPAQRAVDQIREGADPGVILQDVELLREVVGELLSR